MNDLRSNLDIVIRQSERDIERSERNIAETVDRAMERIVNDLAQLAASREARSDSGRDIREIESIARYLSNAVENLQRYAAKAQTAREILDAIKFATEAN